MATNHTSHTNTWHFSSLGCSSVSGFSVLSSPQFVSKTTFDNIVYNLNVVRNRLNQYKSNAYPVCTTTVTSGNKAYATDWNNLYSGTNGITSTPNLTGLTSVTSGSFIKDQSYNTIITRIKAAYCYTVSYTNHSLHTLHGSHVSTHESHASSHESHASSHESHGSTSSHESSVYCACGVE